MMVNATLVHCFLIIQDSTSEECRGVAGAVHQTGADREPDAGDGGVPPACRPEEVHYPRGHLEDQPPPPGLQPRPGPDGERRRIQV